MKRLLSGLLLATSAFAETSLWDRIEAAIGQNLGRPYVWGADGKKSFDCSGFVWRVMFESGVPIKRTTARKFYVALPQAAGKDPYQPGNLVFFDDLRHVGIVKGPESFYHAARTQGTTLSTFEPYWQPKVFGFRALPAKDPGK